MSAKRQLDPEAAASPPRLPSATAGGIAQAAPGAPDCCEHCGTKIRSAVTECIGCGLHVGFPNVRNAECPAEREALAERYALSLAVARATSSEAVLQHFVDALRTSNVVIARGLSVLDNIT